ncbi:MAG: hypothetical protein JSU63_05830 [Phycisphaerales bacterium]|nr:MAG: hypothetical protein JSU63_05830 [Phycisphaerales bacterium]
MLGGALDRRVWRIQRQLRSLESGDSPIQMPLSDLTELKARVRRLHDMGDRYKHVGLSRFVACSDIHGARIRVGGECVATEA